MKALKIAIMAVLVFVVLAVAGGMAFLASFDANRYIPQVTDAVAAATGRHLSVDHAALRLSWTQGVVLELKGLALSDAPLFSDKPFVTVASVGLCVDLGAFLTERKIVVSRIDVMSPRIVIIRTKDGAINAAAMKPATDPSGSASVSTAGSPAGTAALPALLVRHFTVHDGQVVYIDRSVAPALEVPVNKITLAVEGFSLTDPFRVDMKAALFAPAENVTAGGTGRVDLPGLKGVFSDGKAVLTLDPVSADLLNAAVAALRPLGFRSAGGTVTAAIKSVSVGVPGLLAMDAAIDTDIRTVVLGGGNMLAAALNAIPLPGLADAVIADLPALTQQDIKNGVSVIDRIAVSAALNKESFTLVSGSLAAREIEVTANGRGDFAGPVALQGQVYIAKEIATIMMQKAGDLSAIQEGDGRLRIPFSVGGVMAAPKVKPDAEYLARKLLVSRGKQELKKFLGDEGAGKAVDTLLNTLFNKK